MNILVANIGSTSLKYRLFDFSSGEGVAVAKGGFERVSDYGTAIQELLAELRAGGHLSDGQRLDAVGFKTVVADGVTGVVELDDAALEAMERLNDLAPAHNPPYIQGVRVFREAMPDTPMIGLFETAFYQWIPETAKRYGVPQSWFEAGVRRWGFHGASHKYVSERVAHRAGRDDVAQRLRGLYHAGPNAGAVEKTFRTISLHLGGSSSITATRDGVAIGNSMGLSPQSGLPHNNRVGDLDSFAIPFAATRLNLTIDEASRALSKEGGLLGISGVSNDLRDVDDAAQSGNSNAQLALDFLASECRRWMGSYHFEMGGVDAIVFTAGIGENRSDLREQILQNLDGLGIRLDPERNRAARGVEAKISTDDSCVEVWTIPTNEESVVASETKRFLDNRASQ